MQPHKVHWFKLIPARHLLMHIFHVSFRIKFICLLKRSLYTEAPDYIAVLINCSVILWIIHWWQFDCLDPSSQIGWKANNHFFTHVLESLAFSTSIFHEDLFKSHKESMKLIVTENKSRQASTGAAPTLPVVEGCGELHSQSFSTILRQPFAFSDTSQIPSIDWPAALYSLQHVACPNSVHSSLPVSRACDKI